MKTTSVSKKINFGVMLIAVFFLLEYAGVYFSSQIFFKGLSSVYNYQTTAQKISETQQLLEALINIVQKIPHEKSANENSKVVFNGTHFQLLNSYNDLKIMLVDKPELILQLNNHQAMLEELKLVAIRLYEQAATQSQMEVVQHPDYFVFNQLALETTDILRKINLLISTWIKNTFDETYENRNIPLFVSVVLTFVFLVFTLIIGTIFSQNLARSISNLIQATHEVAKGNLAYRAPIVSLDEVGQLTMAFNQMSEKLQQITVSQEYIEAVIESMPDTLLLTDLSGKIVMANQAALNFLEYQESELLGRVIDDLFLEKLPNDSFESVRNAGYINEELTITTKLGNKFPVVISMSLLKENPSRDPIIIYVVKNIAEKKLAEKHYWAVAETASESIITADEEGKITYVNQSVEKMFGYAKNELKGKLIKILMPDRFHESHDMGFKRFLQTGEAHIIGKGPVELSGKRKDASEFPLEIALTSWSIGDKMFFSSIIRDITERKKIMQQMEINSNNLRLLSEKLEQRNHELAAANKELEAFSYSVSHDLRAPLRSMDGFSKALLNQSSDKLDAKGKDYLSRIRKSCIKMGQLIDDFLNLSRLGRAAISISTVNLSELANQIISELQATEPERKVNWIIPKEIIVQADRNLMLIVLQNLFSNAWKFTAKHAQAQIELGITQQNNQIVYFVKDDGAGFDMSYADKLFTPFQRLHTENEFPGTGIGLALIKRIISRHGGNVWVNAEVEKGTTIYFTLGDGHGRDKSSNDFTS